jgi:phosphatidate cytidylyltransferase
MPGKGARIAIRFLGTPGMVAAVALLIYLESGRAEPLYIPLLVVAAGVGALAEIYRIFRIKGYRPAALLGIAAVALTLARPLSAYDYPYWAPSALLALSALAALVFRHGRFSVEDAALTLFGFAYAALIVFVYVAFEFEKQAATYLVFLLVATKAPDTAAYLAGKAFGRRRMAPVLSPNKTWEGFAAGVAAGIGGGFYVAAAHLKPACLGTGALIVLCASVTLASILGDLVKSALKRWAGVKDSGFIPEFGGVLDIVDSFLLSAPAAALVLHVLRLLA